MKHISGFIPKLGAECRQYQPLNKALVEQYDNEMRAYYAARTSNNKDQGWTSQIRGILSKEARPFMLDYLQQKGFCKK